MSNDTEDSLKEIVNKAFNYDGLCGRERIVTTCLCTYDTDRSILDSIQLSSENDWFFSLSQCRSQSIRNMYNVFVCTIWPPSCFSRHFEFSTNISNSFPFINSHFH